MANPAATMAAAASAVLVSPDSIVSPDTASIFRVIRNAMANPAATTDAAVNAAHARTDSNARTEIASIFRANPNAATKNAATTDAAASAENAKRITPATTGNASKLPPKMSTMTVLAKTKMKIPNQKKPANRAAKTASAVMMDAAVRAEPVKKAKIVRPVNA